MRVDRLSQLFEHKYDLYAEAVPSDLVIKEVKRNLADTYNLYVNEKTAKEPVLQMLANAGEPFSKTLISIFQTLIASMDASSNSQLFVRVNNLLGMIADMTKNKSVVRDFIHGAVRVTKESERNYREHLKSKFEMVIGRISSLLTKQAKLLRATLPKGTSFELEGGPTDVQRKALSKEKLLMFMRTPAAQHYKLDNLEVMQRLLSFPEMRSKLTTLINAIDRGHIPVDGPEIMSEVQDLRKWLSDKETNTGAFEQENTPTPRSPEDWFDTGTEPEHQVLGDPNRADPSVLEPPQYQQVKKEDEEAARRKKEWEEKMFSKYNSASLYQFLRKV